MGLLATPVQAEVESLACRVAVPGIALHPSGALIYEPFLYGPPLTSPSPAGIRGGIDIRDAHNGQPRLRVYLPEPIAIDGLHGEFLTTDENGLRIFVITASGFTVGHNASLAAGA